MATNHPLGIKLVKDAAGTCEYYPPPAWGACTATITIKKPGGDDLPTAVSGDAMTADSVSTTLSADPALGATSVSVADASNIAVGRSYILQTASQRERVVVKAISGTTITLVDQLQLDHASGATFKGHRLTFALASGQQATADRSYRAVLTVTDEDSTVHPGVVVLYHVVHGVWRLPTTPEDVLRSWADALMQDALRDRGADFAGLLDAAAEEIAVRFIRPAGYFEDQFHDFGAFVPLHVCLVRRMLVEKHRAHDAAGMVELATYWDDKAEAKWELLLQALPAYDSDNDGVVDEGEEGIEEDGAFFAPESDYTANPQGLDVDVAFEPTYRKVGTSNNTGRSRW